jgi:hypothetical protein
MRCAAVIIISLYACKGHAPPPSIRAEAAVAVPSASPAPSTSASSAASASAAPPASDAAAPQEPTPAPAPPTPRVYVRAHSLPIFADPGLKGDWIGLLVAGDSVRLRPVPPATTRGCASTRAVEPRGWVCVDGDSATLDASDAVYLALRSHAPDYSSPLPYLYGESRGTRRQRTVPGMQSTAWPPVVFDPRAEVSPRSTVSWLDEVQLGGTTWLRASDMSYLPKDKIVPFERGDFHGVELGGDVKLPVAFFKGGPHIKYRRGAKDRLVATDESWPRLAWVGLTGHNEKRGSRTFWETREEGVWIDARGAAIAAPDGPPAPVPHGSWIEVAALQGWLVAWQGDTAVYATMISAGKLGAAKHDPEHEPHQPPATTPLGTFRIREKLVTTTLQSDLDDGTDFIHADVPWSQRFFDKYLLHTAYWHDRWGEGHSGGCVNLSPADAKWLFGWSEPHVPEDWHAVRVSEARGELGSVVVVHP